MLMVLVAATKTLDDCLGLLHGIDPSVHIHTSLFLEALQLLTNLVSSNSSNGIVQKLRWIALAILGNQGIKQA